MKYYAYLKQKGYGCDYMIGCGNILVKIEASSDKEANTKLSDIIKEEYYGERELEYVKLFKEEIPFNLKGVYDEMKIEKENRKKELQHIKDKEEFERLKKKLGQ